MIFPLSAQPRRIQPSTSSPFSTFSDALSLLPSSGRRAHLFLQISKLSRLLPDRIKCSSFFRERLLSANLKHPSPPSVRTQLDMTSFTINLVDLLPPASRARLENAGVDLSGGYPQWREFSSSFHRLFVLFSSAVLFSLAFFVSSLFFQLNSPNLFKLLSLPTLLTSLSMLDLEPIRRKRLSSRPRPR